MDFIRSFVASRGVNLLNTAAVRLGLGSSTRLALLNGFSSLMTGTFGSVIAVAMFPSLYLYDVINNLNVSVPNWISDGVSWLVNTLRPAWWGVVNGVQSWQNWYNNRLYDIRNVVSMVVGNLDDFRERVNWLWNNGYNLISILLHNAGQWIWDRLPQWARDGLLLVYNNWGKVQHFIDNALEFVLRLARDPLRVIYELFPQALRDAWTLITADIKYLAWLFGEAKENIVAFLSDPREFIKAHIFEPLLEWLLEAIEEAW